MPRLSGPHVPKFVAAGDFAVQPYIVMERIAGKSLLPRLKKLPLPYAEVADLGVKIATALDALHRQHVVHLDIKPSNIVLRPSGEAVLLDYGLSHHEQLPDLMQEEFRVPFGTAPYMSPEQLKGIRSDPRSDQFALGVLLYFFSTGVRPFGEGETLGAHAPTAVARSGAAAQAQGRLSAMAAGDRAALSRERGVAALSDGGAACFRTQPSRSGQADAALGADEARSADRGTTPPLQHRPDRAAPQAGGHRAIDGGADRRRGGRSRRGRHAQRGAAHHDAAHAGDAAVGSARLPERSQAASPGARHHARQRRPQQAGGSTGGAAALGRAAQARRRDG